ncbi:SNF2 superfamily chromatin remodeling protein [Auricularia subglabra TFB-10046 SS5]|nr:SNF2 superfamily chromatin remodeling protein [Auricularia subglabra TFB-10046 SS5]
MSSRLDRLLLLLDTGSSPAIRTTAAKQLAHLAAKTVRRDVGGDDSVSVDAKGVVSSSAVADIPSSEWTELLSVVARIIPYLHSKSTDTRTAASVAISNICSLVPTWAPVPGPPSDDVNMDAPAFPHFSVAELLASNNLLLASSGKEYAKSAVPASAAELQKARKEAMNRLGIDFLAVGGDDVGEIDWNRELNGESGASSSRATPSEQKTDTDVKSESEETLVKMEVDTPSPSTPVNAASSSKTRAPPAPPAPPSPKKEKEESPVAQDAGMSARERNRLKRKRKPGNSAFVAAPPPPPQGARYNTAAASQTSNKVRLVAKDEGADGQVSPTTAQPGRTEEKVVVDPSKGGQVDPKDKVSSAKALEPSKEGMWIWDGLVRLLEVDLFSAAWEVRHGAAMALREVVKLQGAAGGMQSGQSAADNEIAHEKWCNDLAAKLLCIFVLDRFGDFVSDQVIAPVRETVSQTLASLLLHMPHRSVLQVHNILLEMIKQDFPMPASATGRTHIWEVRHAGLLGVKYEVAVRNDLVKESSSSGTEVLQGVVQAALLGLNSADDDVRSVAASCLLPVASNLVEQLPEELGGVMSVLWECLEGMTDDLSSSVGAVMDLLGKLVTFDKVIEILADPNASRPLSTLAPTLYPFFRHTIKNVRLAVVKTLHSFLMVPNLPRDWISQPFLCLLVQNLVVEEREDIRTATLQAWRTAVDILSQDAALLQAFTPNPVLMVWFEIFMSPIGQKLPVAKFYHPIVGEKGYPEKHNVDKHMINQELALICVEDILRTRLAGAQALAFLMARWPAETRDTAFGDLLRHYTGSTSMLQKMLGAVIVEEWARQIEADSDAEKPTPLVTISPLADDMGKAMQAFLEGPLPLSYHEQFTPLCSLMTECTSLMQGLVTRCKVATTKVPTVPQLVNLEAEREGTFTISTATDIAKKTFSKIVKESLGRTKRKEVALLEEQRKKLEAAVDAYNETKSQYDTRVCAAYAAAVISLRLPPAKLSPIIKGIMTGIKSEDNLDLQTRSANAIAAVIDFCTEHSLAQPPVKIVQNLCTFLCFDEEHTPVFSQKKTIFDGVLSFKSATAASPAKAAANDKDAPAENAKAKVMYRGATLAFTALSTKFGATLFDAVPRTWDCMAQALTKVYGPQEVDDMPDDMMKEDPALAQNVLDSLTVVATMVPTIHETLSQRAKELFPFIAAALRSRYAILRRSAAKCFAQICNVLTTDAMRYLVETILPFLNDPSIVANRQGTVELIYHLVQILDVKALPYVIFLIVPVLGRMSDSDEDVRATATNIFASLVKMVPLEAGLPDPPGFADELLKRREEERDFLSQLLDGSKVVPYTIPVKINAELRKYQVDGISWLAFLAKYQLHGILCDDMGLGKTLQSITILASKHHERAENFKETKSPDATHLPSLVVCPPTLAGHWYHEIKKYTDNLRPLMYVGTTRERTKLLPTLKKYDVVITSYDVVRNDISNLMDINWHYCILDEGHIIKNPRTKLSKAVKCIRAQHRLLLSGTPIQNNVLELWSLFDFLMPGFLGTEPSFNERFGKPILTSRDAKSSSKASEAAALALEALHKQVLPFLLRRLKEDVLNDLPPKIIQDYTCDLSDLQKHLYDDFSKSQVSQEVSSSIKSSAAGPSTHIFQALQYLRKLCNHPALALKTLAEKNVAELVERFSKNTPASLRDIEHAPKLQALRQLLLDCGIGTSPGSSSGDAKDDLLDDAAASSGGLAQHRVLIFCQMKQMIDIIEEDLFKRHMPSVTYMRLDGNTDASKRHNVVQTFNADPSIDCLLLTTHVGGLGLTLTGADTVIFVEHDWNPMKDLQAMDRAHRLGQKKVVNVYRLITRGTLEEKIMGLQRFKLNIAQSVITQQNSGLGSMDTDQVLDLFARTTDDEEAAAKRKKEKEKEGPVSQKSVLEGLEDLPAEDEYQELDLASFMGSLGR